MSHRTLRNLVFVTAFLLSGCVSGPRVSNFVPSKVTLGMIPTGQEPIYVGPVSGQLVDSENVVGTLKGVGSSAALTSLLEHSLLLHGLQVVPVREQAAYALDCTLSRLGKEVLPGKPAGVVYEAELTCTLFDTQRDLKVWERSLARDYHHTEIVNMMGNIPQNPFKDERRFFQYCIVPLWDAMSGSVWAVFAAKASGQ